MSDSLQRERLVRVARRLDAKGILTATDGNLSMRLDGGALLVTPSGCCKGEVQPDELVRVEPDGASTGRASSELPLHLRVYARRPDVAAVVHAHPPYATAYAVAGIALDQPILSEVVLTLGEVAVVPYARPTGEALADAVESFLPAARALLLRHHGAVSFGGTIEEAGQLMETLEHVAHIDFVRRSLGSAAVLAGDDVTELLELRRTLFGR